MASTFAAGSSTPFDGGMEQRTSARKPLKTRAVLTVKGAAPLSVRTLDISAQGISLRFLQPLPTGLTGSLAIDLLIDGVLHTITVTARAAYCIFSEGSYKAGFQFTAMDLKTVTLLAKFLR